MLAKRGTCIAAGIIMDLKDLHIRSWVRVRVRIIHSTNTCNQLQQDFLLDASSVQSLATASLVVHDYCCFAFSYLDI